jgi:hypothetical protein
MGQTWLPIGKPSGVAESLAVPAAARAAAPEPTTTFSINFRLEIGVITISF